MLKYSRPFVYWLLFIIALPSFGLNCHNLYYQQFLQNPSSNNWEHVTDKIHKNDSCYGMIQLTNQVLTLYIKVFLPNCQALADNISCDQHIAEIIKSIKIKQRQLKKTSQPTELKRFLIAIANMPSEEETPYAAAVLYQNLFGDVDTLLNAVKDPAQANHIRQLLTNPNTTFK